MAWSPDDRRILSGNEDGTVKVWDALMDKGKQFDIHAAGMLALDVARVEAGLLLIEVDYSSSKKALISSQKYSPYELGFEKMVHLQKENFVGKAALERDHKQGVPRQLVGLEIDWNEVEARYDKFGLSPAAPSQASRVPVPLYLEGKQVGKETTTTWSPVLNVRMSVPSMAMMVRLPQVLHGASRAPAAAHTPSPTMITAVIHQPRHRTVS